MDTPYICTVICAIYRVRREGKKLDHHLPAVVGDLLVKPTSYDVRVMEAELLGANGAAVLPGLRSARMRVTSRGIIISGEEYLGSGGGRKVWREHQPQTWWCKPVVAPGQKPGS